jgi:transcriptional regulator with XRE-family HTH domain
MAQLGEILRQRRKELSLSQAKAAVRAGLDPSTWNQVETGVRRPSTATLEKIAVGLDLEMADLFAGYHIPKVQAPFLPLEETGRRLAGMQREIEEVMRGAGSAPRELYEIAERIRLGIEEALKTIRENRSEELR